jgi:hypothetical protein
MALAHDGTECCRFLQRPSHEFCLPHHREYVGLNGQYKNTEDHYNQLVELKGGLDVEKKREKVALGRKTPNLRNQVNRRFFSQHAQNRGHVRRVLKLEDEIKVLECSLKLEEDHGKSLSSPEISEAKTRELTQEHRVYRSLISPEIPMSALDHLPADSPAKLIKQVLRTIALHFVSAGLFVLPREIPAAKI